MIWIIFTNAMSHHKYLVLWTSQFSIVKSLWTRICRPTNLESRVQSLQQEKGMTQINLENFASLFKWFELWYLAGIPRITDVEQASSEWVDPEGLVTDHRETWDRKGHGRVALCDDEGAPSRVLTSWKKINV